MFFRLNYTVINIFLDGSLETLVKKPTFLTEYAPKLTYSNAEIANKIQNEPRTTLKFPVFFMVTLTEIAQ